MKIWSIEHCYPDLVSQQKLANFLWLWQKALALSSRLCQTSKMELFAKLVNSWKPLTSFAESFIFDVEMDSEYVTEFQIFPKDPLHFSIKITVLFHKDYWTGNSGEIWRFIFYIITNFLLPKYWNKQRCFQYQVQCYP